jgi:hypothetical protein
MTKSVKKTTAKKTAKKTAAPKKINGGKSNKSARVIAMMRKAGGCTREDILQATGWKAVSPAAIGESSGFKVKINTDQRPYRYLISGG